MSILVHIRVDDKGNAKIVELGKNTEKLKDRTTELDKVMRGVFAAGAVLYGINLIREGISKTTEEVFKFEYAMKKIEGIGGVTGKSLASVGKQARDLALDTEFSASKISEAMLELVKQGFDDPQALTGAMPHILDLATSATMELNYAAENTIATLRAFNLENNEVARVANVMATGLNKTAMGAEDYMEAMKYVAPVANSLNVSLEETSAVLGALSDAGIKGSLAGTTLKNILLNLLKPGDAVAVALQNMNLEGKSLVETLKGLKDQGLSVIDFLDTFDKRAITGAELLANEDVVNKVRNLDVALVEQLTKVENVSDTIRDAFIPQWQILVNNLNEVALSIYDAFGDRPTTLIQGLVKNVQDLDKWVDNNHETVKRYADTAVSIFSFISSVGVNGLKFAAGAADDLAIALGLVFGVSIVNKSYILLSNVEKVAKVSKTVSFTGFLNSINLAIIAGTTLKTLIEGIADSWSEAIDKQTELSKTDLKNTEKKLEAVNKIVNAYSEVSGSKLVLDNLNARKMSSPETREKFKKADREYSVAKLNLSLVLKEYENTFGKAALAQVDTAEEARRWQAVLSKVYQKQKEEAEKLEKPKSSSKEKKKKSTLSDQVTESSTDEFKMWGDNDFILKYLNKYYDKQAEDLLNFQMGITEDFEELNKINEELDKAYKELAEINRKEMFNFLDSVANAAISVSDTLDAIQDAQLEKTLARLSAEESAIKHRYNLEIAAAGSNSFKKQMLELESAQKTKQIQDKMEKEKKEAAKRDKKLALFQATLNTFVGVNSVLAQQPGGIITKLAAGATLLAYAMTMVGQISSLNLRSGTGGVYEGDGNITSDSILAKVSKGERVLSGNEIDSLGGNETIQAMIDRGSSYGAGKNVYIDTFIGNKSFAREIIPVIRKELTR